MDEALNKLSAYLADRLGGKLLGVKLALGELTIEISRDNLIEVMTILRDDSLCRFGCLIDICGADYPDREERFDVVYHLLSPWLNHRIRVRIRTDEAHPVPSLIGLFPALTGSSARPSISMASCSPATRTCAASSPTMASRAILCARTSRSPASSSFVMTTS